LEFVNVIELAQDCDFRFVQILQTAGGLSDMVIFELGKNFGDGNIIAGHFFRVKMDLQFGVQIARSADFTDDTQSC
jgi:hypothetical protein